MTDAALDNLKQFTDLRTLDLCGTTISGTGLKVLDGLARLKDLNLPSTKITDAGLEHVGRLKMLWGLNLYSTEITDAGLEHLKRMSGLRSLGLDDTRTTREAMEKLERALPNCEISWSPRKSKVRSSHPCRKDLSGESVTPTCPASSHQGFSQKPFASDSPQFGPPNS